MGTRGNIALVKGGMAKVAYNHFDSYPDGLGITLAEQVVSANLDDWRDKFDRLMVVDETEEASPEVLAEAKRRGHWQQVSTGVDWYAALRGIQGNVASYLDLGVMPGEIKPASSVPVDDLWIEWTYVINLDDGSFTVYDGTRQVYRADMRDVDNGELLQLEA